MRLVHLPVGGRAVIKARIASRRSSGSALAPIHALADLLQTIEAADVAAAPWRGPLPDSRVGRVLHRGGVVGHRDGVLLNWIRFQTEPSFRSKLHMLSERGALTSFDQSAAR